MVSGCEWTSRSLGLLVPFIINNDLTGMLHHLGCTLWQKKKDTIYREISVCNRPEYKTSLLLRMTFFLIYPAHSYQDNALKTWLVLSLSNTVRNASCNLHVNAKNNGQTWVKRAELLGPCYMKAVQGSSIKYSPKIAKHKPAKCECVSVAITCDGSWWQLKKTVLWHVTINCEKKWQYG